MGFRPSTDLWKEDAPSRRLLYGAINAHSLGDAYLTDCIKERSKVIDDTKNYDLPWNLDVLSQELEIVRPEIIIALGTKAERFLYRHNFARRYSVVASYHFGISHNWAYKWTSRQHAEQAFMDDFAKAVQCYRTWKANGSCWLRRPRGGITHK